MAGARREGRRRRHGRTRVPLAPGDGRDARGADAARRGERVPEGKRFDAREADRISRTDGPAGASAGGARIADGIRTTDGIAARSAASTAARTADRAAPMQARSGLPLIRPLGALV